MVELNIRSYCNCHATGKWKQQDGYSLDVASGLWVHTRCRKPSKMNYDRNVLGLPQIPQRRGTEDIYIEELKIEARKEIKTELSWEEDGDEDNGWSW